MLKLRWINNKIPYLCLFFSCVSLTCTSYQLMHNQNSTDISVIKDFIDKQALDTKAIEYEKARRILHADLDGDGKEEIIILYSLESFNGTNLYLQYLAVFTNSKGGKLQYVTQKEIGGKNIRTVELNSILNRKIYLNILEYSPNDASCCPSKKRVLEIRYYDNKLKEIKK